MRRLLLLASAALLLGGCAGQPQLTAEPAGEPAAETFPTAAPTTALTTEQQSLLQAQGVDPSSSQAAELLALGKSICIQSGASTTQVMALILQPQSADQRTLAGSIIEHLCPRADLAEVLAGAAQDTSSRGTTPAPQTSKSGARPSSSATRGGSSTESGSSRSSSSTSSSSSSSTASRGGQSSSFDKEWAHVCAGRIVDDIKTLDQRLGDGRISGSGLSLLSQSYRCLSNVGTPPGVDPAKFYGLYSTCADFSDRASDESFSDPRRAQARYVTVKKNTTELLQMISKGTGKQYRL